MSVNNEYKIAIIGPLETVSGFRALGVDSFQAQNAEEALEQLKNIKAQTLDPDSSDKYAVVCIIENLVTLVDQAEYEKVVSGPLPAVVLLPGPEGSSGFAVERLRRLAEKAVGSAII
jgi:V/A-type H+-transporting ATPase subunit F